ncbi:hypothetical protein SEA_BUZZBUZZ_74 [Mycobacterium phage BuzzBuzz]|uniref:Uncharacterized protein n=5 Tax=Mycobacterium phage Bxz2 TaxID=205870 RepID=A0A1B1SFD2_BPMB2|nr:site-specific recombination directionality factor RDF [Mycobacterium phage Bxz2]ANU79408.1 hypothetical protein SEA_BUZZBUZZ_74 [Mycobacterium phage BuzzBuzz]AOZ64848.1 hypothetical protein SEA_LOUIE6_79 [Mycobacterium phage Louie6]ASM62494.1 hypothetical protein SEA_KADY_77 [Mycobacterium phage KADY]QAY17514.1 hypothetical protein SEA_DAISHI_79 [Mycobacterium phage Daishi]UAJ16584.1 hypothetical protein SEA_LARRYKAY_80 [Mycobacterium phage LarryKay]WNN93936.1 hypothetical protein SEA_HASH
MKGLIAAMLAALGLLLTPAPAQAGPTCEHRSAAHIAEHGGINADSAWHVAHGQLPTCDHSSSGGEARNSNGDNDNEKSRFCRKRWYC